MTNPEPRSPASLPAIILRRMAPGVYDVAGTSLRVCCFNQGKRDQSWSAVELGGAAIPGAVARAGSLERLRKLLGLLLRDRAAGCANHPSTYGGNATIERAPFAG